MKMMHKDDYTKLCVKYGLFSMLLQLSIMHKALHVETKETLICVWFYFCVQSVWHVCVPVLFRLILHCEWRGRAAGDHVTRVRLNPAPARFLGVTQGSSCGYCAHCQIYTHACTHTAQCVHRDTSALTVNKLTLEEMLQPRANFLMTPSVNFYL